ncbi:hypothetical protein QUB63_18005 [Microcoleus sp. ARI1-B5]|uniref:ISAzo13-like element transposase-related protein n=1 Tax=unclassified Microcoleus TaxID=2642155 RepID=UPI002FD0A584
MFKSDLQKLVDELGIEIRIAHYPPYTSRAISFYLTCWYGSRTLTDTRPSLCLKLPLLKRSQTCQILVARPDNVIIKPSV